MQFWYLSIHLWFAPCSLWTRRTARPQAHHLDRGTEQSRDAQVLPRQWSFYRCLISASSQADLQLREKEKRSPKPEETTRKWKKRQLFTHNLFSLTLNTILLTKFRQHNKFWRFCTASTKGSWRKLLVCLWHAQRFTIVNLRSDWPLQISKDLFLKRSVCTYKVISCVVHHVLEFALIGTKLSNLWIIKCEITLLISCTNEMIWWKPQSNFTGPSINKICLKLTFEVY